MSGKIICPECHGNGYLTKPVDVGRKIYVDCEYCKNQGEVDITEQVLSMLEASGRRLV